MNRMKWLVLGLVVCLVAPAAMGSALVTKGTSELEVSGMLDFATFQGVETTLNAKYAYFFWDRVALGVRGMLYNNDAVNYYGLGVGGEYNFELPASYRPAFGTDIVPYVGGSVDFRRAKLFDETEDAVVFGGEAGVKFFLTDSTAFTLSLVGELATEDIYDDDLEATDKNLALQVGMRFYF